MSGSNQLNKQFTVKIEAVAFKSEPFEAVAPEDFIHGERVAQPNAEGKIDEQGEAPVAEIEHESLDRLVREFSNGLTALPMTCAEYKTLTPRQDRS